MKGGQAEARGGWADEVAAGADGQGKGHGQRAAEGPRADPFNFAKLMAGVDMRRREWRESVVADILEVSADEENGAGRMAVEGGPGQPSAPHVPAAAMKTILSEVRRREEGKGGQGQPEAGAAGSGDSSVSARGRGRTGTGGKGTSVAVHAKGHRAGNGGKGSGRGRQWPQPERSFRQSPPGSPPQVSAAVRAEEEREVRRQQAVPYVEHVECQHRRHPPPEQGPDTIYRLEMEPGRTGSGRQGGLEGSGGERGGQPSGGMRREVGQAEQSSTAAEGHRGQREGEQETGSQRSGHTGSAVQGKGAGQVEGGGGKQSRHGTQGKGAGQEGLQGKGHWKAGLR